VYPTREIILNEDLSDVPQSLKENRIESQMRKAAALQPTEMLLFSDHIDIW
jgi:hypothetical protein